MKTPLTLNEALVWSTLDPRPVIFYDKKNDTYLAAWNGTLMTHKQALLIASSIFFDIWPSPKMKSSAFNEFKQLYYSNAFGITPWGTITSNPNHHFSILHLKIYQHFEEKLKSLPISPSEVLSWFSLSEKQYD